MKILKFIKYIMPISFNNTVLVNDKGKNKRIYWNCQIPNGLNINFKGINNHIIIPRKKCFKNCVFDIEGNNADIEIKETNKKIKKCHIHTGGGDNQRILIGTNFSCEECGFSLWDENATIIIGDDCMFASQIIFLASDGHTIYTTIDKKCINKTKTITIRDHVWIGRNTHVLKGSYIEKNCIVGLGSIVNKQFNESNAIIAGNPAKIVKHNVCWDIKTTQEYCKKGNK